MARLPRGKLHKRRVLCSFDSFADDLKHDTLPDYSFIAPNLYNDGHHDPVTGRSAPCGDHRALQGIDAWLKTNMEPLIKSEIFKRGGLLVIVFDEDVRQVRKRIGDTIRSRRDMKGGGHIPALIISSRTPAGTTRNGLYHHESILPVEPAGARSGAIPGPCEDGSRYGRFFQRQDRQTAVTHPWFKSCW